MAELVRLVREDYMQPTSSLRLFYHILDGSSRLHWHDFYEVFLVVDGSGWHLLNGKMFPLNPGSMFLITPTDFHELIPQGKSLHLYNLIFTENCVVDELYSQLFHDLSKEHFAVFHDKALLTLQMEFQRLWDEYNHQSIGYQIVLEGGLNRILVELLRQSRTSNSIFETASADHPAIRRALIYMHNHFRENLYLKDVAQQANLAPNYFSEAFHKLTGIPFQTYLQDLRLRFALALLRVSDLSVTEICYASGFNTLSHFLRVFKQKFHQSPNTFRRETPDFKAICIPGCSICSHPQHVLSSSQKTMCQSKH